MSAEYIFCRTVVLCAPYTSTILQSQHATPLPKQAIWAHEHILTAIYNPWRHCVCPVSLPGPHLTLYQSPVRAKWLLVSVINCYYLSAPWSWAMPCESVWDCPCICHQCTHGVDVSYMTDAISVGHSPGKDIHRPSSGYGFLFLKQQVGVLSLIHVWYIEWWLMHRMILFLVEKNIYYCNKI